MRDHLARIFAAGVAACHPRAVLPAHLPAAPKGRLIVLAVGKAAAAMAEVAEARYGARAEGIAVVPRGTAGALHSIELLHAGHPLPNEESVAAAERLLALAGEAGQDDVVLVLLSGGASALACLPGKDLSLEEKRDLNRALLRSGASIGEVNCVRRHLSRIKGGRLRADLTLAISDVRGDPRLAPIIQCVSEEGGAIARAHGFEPSGAPQRPGGGHGSGRIDHKPSMVQDYELGRPMEVEAQLAMPLAFARAAAVATPTLDALVALVAHKARAKGLYP